LLFQVVTITLATVMFLLFMAGFYYAAFSGMIARTGVTDPELTSNLIVAWVVGFAIVFFFQFALPWWGLWAGIRVLRGHAFRYPLLGKLAIRWTSRRPFEVEPTARVSSRLSSADTGQNILGVLAHLLVPAGMSVIVSPVLWAATRPRSRYLTHHLLQAPLFQISTTAVMGLSALVIWGGGVLGTLASPLWSSLPPPVISVVDAIATLTLYPLGWMLLLGLFWVMTVVSAVVAAIQTAHGREFNYPVVGRWVAKYIQ
jgi:uncharacterized Tic20 family protein